MYKILLLFPILLYEFYCFLEVPYIRSTTTRQPVQLRPSFLLKFCKQITKFNMIPSIESSAIIQLGLTFLGSVGFKCTNSFNIFLTIFLFKYVSKMSDMGAIYHVIERFVLCRDCSSCIINSFDRVL